MLGTVIVTGAIVAAAVAAKFGVAAAFRVERGKLWRVAVSGAAVGLVLAILAAGVIPEGGRSDALLVLALLSLLVVLETLFVSWPLAASAGGMGRTFALTVLGDVAALSATAVVVVVYLLVVWQFFYPY